MNLMFGLPTTGPANAAAVALERPPPSSDRNATPPTAWPGPLRTALFPACADVSAFLRRNSQCARTGLWKVKGSIIGVALLVLAGLFYGGFDAGRIFAGFNVGKVKEDRTASPASCVR